MKRLITMLASFAIVIGLGACCCPCGPMLGGGNNRPPNQIVFNPPPIVVNPGDGNVKPSKKEPAVVAVEARGGMVLRENNVVVEVNLNSTNTTDADLKSLATFTQLRKLQLPQNNTLTGVGFRDLRALQRLEELDVSGCPINDEGMRHIAALRQLKILNIASTKITDIGMKEADLDKACDIAMSNQYPNPRPLERAALRQLLQDAFEGVRPAA